MQKKQLTTRLCLAIALVFSLMSLPGMAQVDTAGFARKGELDRAVERLATSTLQRHLRPEEFQVFATTVPAEGGEEIPYMPETLAPIAGPSASPTSLKELTQSIALDVLVAELYDTAARERLRLILTRALLLDEARGDRITFSPLGLAVERPEPQIARELARSEAEARDIKSRLDILGRERDDAKRDASDAKRDLTVLKSELDRMKQQLPAGDSATNPDGTPAEPTSSSSLFGEKFWAENTVVLVGMILALIAIFFSGRGLKDAARTMGDAVQSVAAGIPALGERLGESMAQNAVPALPPSNEHARGVELPSHAASGQLSAATMPIESVHRRVLELHDELSAAINIANEGLVLEYLSQMLADDSSVGRAVATMELLGNERANYLYSRLSTTYQQRVFEFLKSGVHSRPKGEVMLEAGEELKTKLFRASLVGRVKLDNKVTQKILQLTVDDRFAVAARLESEALARFFLYLQPGTVAEILTHFQQSDERRFERIASVVVKMPEVEAAAELDGEILAVADAQISQASADLQTYYLPYYKTIVESVDDEVAESLAEHFASASPRVEKFVRESIVTFGTFFKLHGDIQEDIISSMSNKDLAALVCQLKPELKAVIYSHTENRQQELIEEEVERLSGRGLRQAIAVHKAAKRDVVAQILRIKGSASLADLLQRDAEALPAADDTKTQAA